MPRKPTEPPIVCKYFIWYLRKKKSGVYYADGRSNSEYIIGKPSLGTRDREEALRRLKELDLHLAIKFGIAKPIANPNHQDVKIVDGWDLYKRRCQQPEILGGTSEETWKRYRAVMNKHIKFCNQKGYQYWSEVNKKTTLEYGGFLAELNLADRTIVLELNTICSVSKWLVEEEHLPPSCQYLLKLSKPEGSDTYCYTKPEVIRIIGYCKTTDGLHWLAPVITALATTGLRINELASLRWTDIDLESNTVRLTDERSRPRKKQTGKERRVKGKRARAIPIHPEFKKVLTCIPKHRDGFVFHGKKGGLLDDRRVLEALQDRVIEALKDEFPTPDGQIGFINGVTHGFRHYFCSEAYRNGATDAELLEWLGHRDSEIMRLYRHLRPEDGQRKMEQINFLGSDDEKGQQSDVA